MKKIYFASLFFLLSISVFSIGPWTQVASLGGLGRHRAFAMNIGNRGYVGGGWNGSLMYYDQWEYDPGTNSWTQKADCPTQMWSDPAFGIGNKGYVVEGGYTYMFDPLNNTWTIVNFSSPNVTYYDQVKFVVSGKGYACDGNYIYEFDPGPNTWTARYFVSGGFYGDMAFGIGSKGYLLDDYYNIFYEYDPVGNTLIPKANFPGLMSQGTSFSVNGKGYAGLGQVPPSYNDVQQMFEYDPVLDSWQGINDFEGAGRENGTSFTIGAKVYITCGTSGINMNDCWEFNNAYETGIENLSLSSVSLFPNPSVDGKYFLKQEPNASKTVCLLQIFDVNGRLIKTISTHGDCVIDLSEMTNAQYNVLLFDEENKIIENKKIVLAK